MITLVGMFTRTSGEIRCRQVAERLGNGAAAVDVHSLDQKKLSQNDIVLLCRTWNADLVHELKRRGHKVGYDIADMPVGDAVFRNKHVEDLRDYVHLECDFFVVNNSWSKQEAELYAGERPVFVVPHHSTNVDDVRAPFNVRPRRVGYVGLPEQLSARDAIERSCDYYGAEFVSVHPNTREECDRVFRGLDVGIVFAENDSTMRPHVVDLMKRYKPNVKLSNFQSYGIPTIATPYKSYLEFGNVEWRIADSQESMLENLEQLLDDSEARHSESAAAYAHGRTFHIDTVLETYYRPMLKVVSELPK